MTDSVESVLQKLAEELATMWPVNGYCWADGERIVKERSGNIMAKLRSALEPMLTELKRQLRSENIVAQNEIRRAEAAEAENEKLRELLSRSRPYVPNVFKAQIDEALSPSPTPAPDTNTQSLCRANLSPDSATPAQPQICNETVMSAGSATEVRMSASKLAEQIADRLLDETVTRHGSVCWPGTEFTAKALDEMALRVFEDTRERAAKIAADAIAPNRRDIAEAIRAMQQDLCPK